MAVRDALDSLNKTYFENLEEPVRKIYVDMEMLQDFRIGALLTFATVPEEIEYVQHCIPNYNNRFDLETAKYFPVLKKTDQELDERVKEKSRVVSIISPWTRIFHNFLVVLKFLYLRTSEKDKVVAPLTIIVNCADTDYPLDAFDRFANTIQTAYPGATVKLSRHQRYDAGIEVYKTFDMYFLYDHEAFFGVLELVKTLMNEETYKTRTIYTRPYINPKLELDPSEYAKGFASTSATLNLFFDFFYMKGGIDLNTASQES